MGHPTLAGWMFFTYVALASAGTILIFRLMVAGERRRLAAAIWFTLVFLVGFASILVYGIDALGPAI